MAKSIEEQWAAVQAAITALAGMPSEIAVGLAGMTEEEVETWGRLIPGAIVERFCSVSAVFNGDVRLIYSFAGSFGGVRLKGQGSRVVTREEAAKYPNSIYAAGNLQSLTLAEAFPGEAA
jgi:hypothetical protein